MWSLLACSLLALLATGTCIECDSCSGSGNNCTGYERKTCKDDEDTCVISVWDLSDSPLTLTIIHKGCGKSSTCKSSVAELNLGHGFHVRGHRVCCTGAACNDVTAFDVPPPDTKPNGLRCPGCIGLFKPTCHGEPVACVGSQNKCLDVSVNATGFPHTMDFSGKACVTELVCNLVHHGISSFLDDDRLEAALSKSECIAATKPE